MYCYENIGALKMITLKLNAALNGLKVGEQITLETDKDGVIIDNFWFRRLQDSERDNCVEIVNNKQLVKVEKTTTKGTK